MKFIFFSTQRGYSDSSEIGTKCASNARQGNCFISLSYYTCIIVVRHIITEGPETEGTYAWMLLHTTLLDLLIWTSHEFNLND